MIRGSAADHAVPIIPTYPVGRTVSPGVPFGGYGFSGIGRENGVNAIREYTETKAVWVELTGSTRDPFTLG